MMNSGLTVVYDACVLYPWCLRDFLVTLATKNIFRAKWTDKIHDEWITALLRRRPEIDRGRLERQKDLMNRAVPGSLVEGYEYRIANLNLPYPDDRHVLAAAIHCDADIILTRNLKDFPSKVLSKFGIEAQDPDEFASYLIEVARPKVLQAIREQSQRCRNPPIAVSQLSDMLKRDGLVASMSMIQAEN